MKLQAKIKLSQANSRLFAKLGFVKIPPSCLLGQKTLCFAANRTDRLNQRLGMINEKTIYQQVLDKLNKIKPVAPDENALLLGRFIRQTLNAGVTLTQAGIIFYFVEEKKVPLAQLKDHFDEQTFTYVADAVTVYDFLKTYHPKLDNILKLPSSNRNRRKNINNLRKFILSILEDFRSIFILDAYFILLLQNYKLLKPQRQKFVRQLVEFVLAPIAHRLGFYKIKSVFDDLILKNTEPGEYEKIRKYIEELKRRATFKDDSEFNLNKFVASVRRLISQNINYKFTIKSRIKSIASIYKKVKIKGQELERLKDIFAIRIILDTEPDPKTELKVCWDVYNLIASKYEIKPGTLKDMISQPKANGYQSLHFTVLAPGDIPVEVQVRTVRMDEIAEKGDAAHWVYKEGGEEAVNKDETFAMLRSIVEENVEPDDEEERFNLRHLFDEIYVFTPDLDIKNLPKGASVLDFAYSIHSNIGAHCTGAIIKPWKTDKTLHVNYRYELENGMTVNILTSPQQEPKTDWLNYVITRDARKQIKNYIKLKQLQTDIQAAKEALERRLERLGYTLSDPIVPKIMQELGYSEMYQLYSDIATGKVDLTKLKSIIQKIKTREEEPVPKTATVSLEPQISGKALIAIYEENQAKILSVNIAKCCHPKPGDKIFVYLSEYTQTVHRADCPNIQVLRHKFPQKIYRAAWVTRRRKISFNELARQNTVYLMVVDPKTLPKDKGQTTRDFFKNLITKQFDIPVKNVYKSRAHNQMLRIHLVLQGKLSQKQKRQLMDFFKRQPWIEEIREKRYNPHVK